MLGLRRVFTDKNNTEKYPPIEHGRRETTITWDRDNQDQTVVEAPAGWSDRAVGIAGRHYLRGGKYKRNKETSIKSMVARVVGAIAKELDKSVWAEERRIFEDELSYILLSQKASFNSPVWYNVGISHEPQTSACFILGVDDTLVDSDCSIMETVKKEARIFKHGSGSGTNLSYIREAGAQLKSGGAASGVLSWMKTLDANAGSIKSGGNTRRAACMRLLNFDHPDIFEFVNLKVREDSKMKALVKAGYGGGLGEEAEQTVTGQNANNSVVVSDSFMRSATNKESFALRSRFDWAVAGTAKAQDLFADICKAAHGCGDPGLFFFDAVNRSNTCKKHGIIDSCNPCSEFVFFENSACNLASINLCRLGKDRFGFPEIEQLEQVIRIMLIAQDILISISGYPAENIKEQSLNFRPLGLGYGNLGALLMANGVAYDSFEARAYAGALTSYLTACAYCVSGDLAKAYSPFPLFVNNKESFLDVLQEVHIPATEDLGNKIAGALAVQDQLEDKRPSAGILRQAAAWRLAAAGKWEDAKEICKTTGFRNAQTTLLAPTGTISFLMDFDTTGIEPCPSLRVTKSVVGGNREIMNFGPLDLAVEKVFDTKGPENRKLVADYLRENGSLEGCSESYDQEQAEVFLCAIPTTRGGPCLSGEAHVAMVAAVQPFLSGAVSKTVNLPSDATEQDVADIFLLAWKSGLKSISCYRDGSKALQVLDAGAKEKKDHSLPRGVRERLPEEVRSARHKFVIGGSCTGFLHVGEDAFGRPKECFLTVMKVGSTVRGILDAFGITISLCLQLGMPLEPLLEKYLWMEFDPRGYTSNKNIPHCTSIIDYVAKYLSAKYLGKTFSRKQGQPKQPDKRTLGAGLCDICSGLLYHSGTCFVCSKCGHTTGCS